MVSSVLVAVLLGAAVLQLWTATALAEQDSAVRDGRCPTGFANFGDSLTDTGNAYNAFPNNIPYGDTSPYGETFFGAPANRFSNGRVVPDFFSLAFRTPLLDGYFAPTTFNFRYGVNFAVGGATAAPRPTALVPFSLTPIQTAQFIRFKRSAKSVEQEEMEPDLPAGDPYPDWLFTINVGGLDLLPDILSGLLEASTLATLLDSGIPHAVGNISAAVQTLYAHSARKFLLFNVTPQGCSTIALTTLEGLRLPTDKLGCIIPVNEMVSAFNTRLNQTVQGLRQELPDAAISLFDYYSANMEILENPRTYGFNPNLTKATCCGAPGVGTLNYNPSIMCGHPSKGSNNCANPEEYLIWDGLHFAESFYRTISKFALSGMFTDEGVNYTAICDLDFSMFGPDVTLRQAYPSGVRDIFD